MADEKPFQDVGDQMVANMADSMRSIVDAIMAQSLIEVPKDTGVLERSAFINEPKESTLGFDITFGYGHGNEINPKTHRLASDYAVPVHEIMEGIGGRGGHGATHEPPTKAKFLEDPILEFAPMVQRTLAISMREQSITKWWEHKGPMGRASHRGLLPGEQFEQNAGIGGSGMVKDAKGRFVRKFTP